MKTNLIRAFRLASVFLITFFFTGCNNGNTSKRDLSKKDTTESSGVMAAPIETNLKILYLENFPGSGHDQLDQLLKKGEKLVFQFYHTDKDELTLMAWPTKQGNTAFDIKDVQELKIKGNSSTDISKMMAYLGDQQISKKDASELSKLVNQNGAQYIFFEPAIDTDHHVYYKLSKSSSNDFANKILTDIVTNPSPPAPAD